MSVVVALSWLLYMAVDGGTAPAVDAGGSHPRPGLLAFPPPPPPPAPVYRLRAVDEGYVYEANTFDAHVGPDGAVRFEDRSSVLGLFLPAPRPLPSGTPTLESALRDRLDPDRRAARHAATVPPGALPTVPRPGRTRPTIEICTERVWCRLESAGLLIAPFAAFDVTDMIMRKRGQDPYAYEKARFLSATMDFRLGLARRHKTRTTREALAALPDRLQAVWADTRFTPVERRRLLWHLWNEAAPGREGDRAAAMILDFIRRRLPPGSPDAYTAIELTQYRRGDGGRLFVPYAPATP